MPRHVLVLVAAMLVAACAPTPIYAPPPGGHDALSAPPPSLLQP